jgi:hypothetical protein
VNEWLRRIANSATDKLAQLLVVAVVATGYVAFDSWLSLRDARHEISELRARVNNMALCASINDCNKLRERQDQLRFDVERLKVLVEKKHP